MKTKNKATEIAVSNVTSQLSTIVANQAIQLGQQQDIIESQKQVIAEQKTLIETLRKEDAHGRHGQLGTANKQGSNKRR